MLKDSKYNAVEHFKALFNREPLNGFAWVFVPELSVFQYSSYMQWTGITNDLPQPLMDHRWGSDKWNKKEQLEVVTG